MCSKELANNHQHLLDPLSRKLICACDACAILFNNQGQTKYKRVPRRIRFLPDFHMTDSQWDGLMMPINMAFFFKSTPQDRVIALYPSPAGATESELPDATFRELAAATPLLREVAPDVEALLVYGRRSPKLASFLVPIDRCYRLVGEVRRHWQGINGGDRVWARVDAFFEDLRARARALVPEEAR